MSGVLQRPLTLILLQWYCVTNATFCGFYTSIPLDYYLCNVAANGVPFFMRKQAKEFVL